MPLDSNTMVGVYLSEEEYGAPVFQTENQAQKLMLTPYTINIPIFNKDKRFLFIVQALTNPPVVV